ncbi:MAG TPA: glycosyltransferase family 4 protein [Hyphomonadaceae bacterium]|nr:glycosyltransferase family 4 protein [Hyphomonadaceae bacterium]
MAELAPQSRSQLEALLALLGAGDLGGLARRAVSRFGPVPLPATLAPKQRPGSIRATKSNRTKPLIWMMGPGLSLDGAPLSQFELATGLAAEGFAIETVVAQDGPLRQRYAESSVGVSVCPELACASSVPAWYENDVQRLVDLLRRQNPDLVIASTIDSFPAIDAARMAGIPSIWNIRESEPWRSRLADRHTAIAARALACFGYPSAMVFVARASQDAWAKFAPSDRSKLIYNAPHPSLLSTATNRGALRARAGAGPDEKLIVSIGTLCERKGQIDLAEAVGLLPADIVSRVKLVFVGRPESAYRARTEAALPAAVRARTQFTGAVPEAMAYVQAADVLVNSSRSEAFPRTLLEAAAARTPIIATAIDGAAERLTDRKSALLYAPGDTAALAAAIVSVLSKPGLAETLQQGAWDTLVSRHSYQAMIGAYSGLVRAALAG